MIMHRLPFFSRRPVKRVMTSVESAQSKLPKAQSNYGMSERPSVIKYVQQGGQFRGNCMARCSVDEDWCDNLTHSKEQVVFLVGFGSNLPGMVGSYFRGKGGLFSASKVNDMFMSGTLDRIRQDDAPIFLCHRHALEYRERTKRNPWKYAATAAGAYALNTALGYTNPGWAAQTQEYVSKLTPYFAVSALNSGARSALSGSSASDVVMDAVEGGVKGSVPFAAAPVYDALYQYPLTTMLNAAGIDASNPNVRQAVAFQVAPMLSTSPWLLNGGGNWYAMEDDEPEAVSKSESKQKKVHWGPVIEIK